MSVEVPEGWEKKCLSEVLVRDTSAISTSELASTGNVYHYSIPAFDEGQAPILEAGSQIRSNKTRISEDCLLFSKLNPRISRVWRVHVRHEFPAVCSTEFWSFMPSCRKSSLDYFKHFFAWDGFLSNPQIKPSSSTNSHQRIDRKAFDAFEVLLPPLPEQQRIAEILSSVDDSIRATEAVIAQAERVKRGLMEDLLTGGLGSAAIANGEVPEGWASDKFINLVTLKRGYDLPVTDRIDGSFLVVASNGPVGTHNIPAVSGPVIVTGRSGTIGKVELYWEDCHPLNTTLYSQNLHGNDPRYVAEYIRFFRLERFATGTGVPTLNRNLVHAETIVIPPFPEQQRIAEILSSFDDEITSNRATVEQLQRLKRGLMDDLLTGKVRTVA